MDNDIAVTIDALDDLLDAEREAVLAGDLEKLTGLVERKEALIDALNAVEQADLVALEALDAKVKRNQQLLDGTLEGIRSVARRMAAFRRVRSSLDTYDAKGEKSSIEMNADHTVEKHA